jgi:hypothetical protein
MLALCIIVLPLTLLIRSPQSAKAPQPVAAGE